MEDSVDFCIADIRSRFAAIDPHVEGVVDRVAAIDKHVSRAFDETLARHGLSHGEYKLLLRLATRSDHNRMSAGDLSRALLLSSGAMTNRLDRLESAGYVQRVRDPRDRRGVLVELTPAGQAKIDEAVTEQAAKECDVMKVLNDKELASLNVLLRKILSSLEEAPSADRAAVGTASATRRAPVTA
ncbi:MAG: MarR family transcriptional regulator [Frankiales bacterium]|nr:MarR family transcriptional regulator [Frankiales bacterium]